LKKFYFYYAIEDSTDLEENLVVTSKMKMLKNLDIFFVDIELGSC